MSALVIPDQYALIRCGFQLPNKTDPGMITFGCKPGTGVDPNSLALAARNAFVTLMNAIGFSNTITITTTTANYMDGGVEYLGSATGSTAGSLTAAVPPNVTVLVKKKTGLAGRRTRGRMYLPGITESSVDNNGDMSSATVATLQTAANAFYSTVQSSPFGGMYLLHAPSTPGTVHPTPVPNPTFVSGLEVETRTATQRRRLRK